MAFSSMTAGVCPVTVSFWRYRQNDCSESWAMQQPSASAASTRSGPPPLSMYTSGTTVVRSVLASLPSSTHRSSGSSRKDRVTYAAASARPRTILAGPVESWSTCVTRRLPPCSRGWRRRNCFAGQQRGIGTRHLYRRPDCSAQARIRRIPKWSLPERGPTRGGRQRWSRPCVAGAARPERSWHRHHRARRCSLDSTVRAAVDWLLSRQDAAGWWTDELETNVTMTAEHVLLLSFF